AFCELFSRELGRCARHAKPLALLIIDIDDFKLVNDRHGHAMGDRVLKAFAALATQELREADVFCRYGGEEFAVLLPDTATAEALVVAQRIRSSFARRAMPGQVPATVSIGLMSSADGSGDMATLIDLADRALYLAKHQGKNRVVLAPEADPMGDAAVALKRRA
ncbi:MAG: GGDEF domain-containing protein, partial [Janthinobacterium lividum]